VQYIKVSEAYLASDMVLSTHPGTSLPPHAGYLGEDREAWKQYDATELLKSYKGQHVPILIDQVGAQTATPGAAMQHADLVLVLLQDEW
jgi:S-formylglutathione hydrolase FrmB